MQGNVLEGAWEAGSNHDFMHTTYSEKKCQSLPGTVVGMLDGRVAIVAGGGRGVGAEVAKMFAANGAKVLVIDGDPCNIKVTTSEDMRLLRAILGVKAPQGRPAHKRF